MASGRNPGLFKPLLFAEQDLDDLVAGLSPPGGPLEDAVVHLRAGKPKEAEVVLTAAMISRPDEVGGWHHLLFAAALERQGKREAMAKRLRTLAGTATESRIRLMAWTALRRRDEETGAPADHVEGIVTEVEVGRGVDTLAVYADGTARLQIYNGKRVLWDAPDDRAREPIRAAIAAAGPLVGAMPAGRLPDEPAAGQARLTVLTPSGPRAVEAPLAEIGVDGAPWAALFHATTAAYERIVAIAGWDKPR